jgi:c-di-GMP-related signal transduction protein
MNDMSHDAAALSLIAMTSYLGRQPILNREGQLVAYELLFRPFAFSDNAEPADGTPLDETRATADIVIETLGELGMESVLAGRTGYINAGRDWLMNEMFTLLPSAHFVVEIQATAEYDDQLVQRIKALARSGYRFAMEDVRETALGHAEVFDCSEVVKIDVPDWTASRLAPFVAAMHRAGKRVVAEKVETPDDYRWTHEAGCDLFQGYYFAHPHLLAVRRIPPLRQALVKLLVMLGAEPPLPTLEDEVKRNPALTMQLLRFASSAHHALTRRRLRIRDAVQLVGTDWLRRWALLALYTDGNSRSVASNALVQLVGTRGRFMELAARRLRPHDEEFVDNAFMTGMTSLLPAVLQRNPGELFSELQLAQTVREAIQTRAGVLGQLLVCAETMESPAAAARVTQMSKDLAPLNAAAVALLSAAAANWMADRTRF